jgi:serpin B
MFIKRILLACWLVLAVLASVHLGCGGGGPARATGIDPALLNDPGDEYSIGGSTLDRELHPSADPADIASVASGNTQFAFDLYNEVKKPGENLFFSPYSISVALAMTYAGARGETERQMADVLHFTLPQERLHPAFNALDIGVTGSTSQGLELKTANSLWSRIGRPFLQSFFDSLAVNYGAKVRQLDFGGDPAGSAEIINQWVEDKTENRIKDLIPPDALGGDTPLVLVNAIYFKAKWLYEFDKQVTFDGDFTPLDGSRVTVPFMTQEEDFPYVQGDGFQAIDLPYRGEKVSMMIILPDEGQFDRVENSLTSQLLDSTIDSLVEQKVNLTMPKFQMEWGEQLNEPLINLGMVDAFGNADFSGMDGTRSMFIDQVLHKAFVLVDEEGTEAAAATAVIMGETAMLTVQFTADHPFIFLIRDRESNSILFLGRVMNPGA